MIHLLKIQSELKVTKGQYNNFGKYRYRSCEDILEAVKPLLSRQKCVLTLSDEVVNIGNRNYVKATATLFDGSGTSISTSAYACEPETKKGMDSSQITGAASSYARKYALNGLFAIDDTKDADSMDNSDKGSALVRAKGALSDLCKTHKISPKSFVDQVEEMFKMDFDDAVMKKYDKIVKAVGDGVIK